MVMSLPTLSTAGFLEDPAQILDKQLAYFFIADQSQSNLHRGMVSSLPFIIKQYSDDKNALISNTETALKTMLDAYYDSCNVIVTIEDNPDNVNEYNMLIDGSVVVNKLEYSIYRLLTISNKSIANVTELLIK